MKLKGSIDICRTSGDQDRINITLRDKLSGVEFIDLEMSVEDFGYAVTGLGCQDITIEVRGLDRIGKRRETKTEIVPFERNITASEQGSLAAANRALKPFEVDGWIGRREDLFNHHKSRGQNAQEIVFVRWVEDKS